MSAALDSKRLGLVFQARPDIIEGITRAADSPGKIALFNEIASHVYDQLLGNGEPAHKKRRIDVDQTNGTASGASGASNAATEAVLLEIKEISVSVPQRKKLELCFTQNYLYARVPGTTGPAPGAVYAWRDIEYAFYLPVPDKAQVQHNYILFPRGSCLPSRTGPPAIEPLVFTVPVTPPKEGTIGGSEGGAAMAVSDTYKSLFDWALGKRLKGVGNDVEIVSANPDKFHSVIRQSHRPNEVAVHVGGFRGSKDGYLFFLENGILWGFKKPLVFIPLNRIAAISYTNVLQITFNIVIEIFTEEDDGATDEFEVGMLDQQDFAGIDEFIRLNQLQDRSMAEQRKGKLQLAENRAKKNAEDGGADGAEDDGLTALGRAQQDVEQQMQDDEDEDEEDYDPGSEDNSDGSGESSDDDDDGDEDGEDDEVEGEEEYDEEEGEEGDEEADAEDGEEAIEEPPPPAPAPGPAKQGWAAVSQPHRTNISSGPMEFDVEG